MRFKEWMAINEVGTSTGDVAGFSRITIPLVRRWWISDWEKELTGEKRKKKQNIYRLPQVSEASSYSYSCVMFRLDKNDAKRIMDWSKENVPEKDLYTDGEKGREDDIHVTVLYGLHTTDANDVKEQLKGSKGGSLTLGKISKFEAKDYDVLKISVDGSGLRKLNKSLKELPYTSKFEDYNPHCTIAYVKKGSCDHLLGDRSFDGMKAEIKSLVFSPSEGEKSTFSIG